MVNVLDVLETIKSSSTTPKKIAETPKVQIEASDAEATKHQAETEQLETKEAAKQILAEETGTATPEAFSEALNYILRHASRKQLTEKEKQEAQLYAQKLKYPKGALIFNGSGEEDFLYCLPDSKEISVCREMGRSFGFPTL
jgi:ribosomal protein L14E/L6E/L27E